MTIILYIALFFIALGVFAIWNMFSEAWHEAELLGDFDKAKKIDEEEE